MKRCPKCGSTDVVRARPIDDVAGFGENELSVATFRDPSAWVFKGRYASRMTAQVCCDCGYVAFRALDPAELARNAA